MIQDPLNKGEPAKVHYNVPQLLFAMVMASINILIWGRRTGKTHGPMALFSLRNLLMMPRSNGWLIGRTYTQLLSRTLPPVIAGWAKLGYRRNEHYWIREFPPAKWNVKSAYVCPIEPEHYIPWCNGSGIYLVSQDRPGTINGVESQWGAGDEAKFLDYEKLKEEALLTLSGQANRFGHLSNYLSLLFMSDMPTTSKGKWLLSFKSQMDEEVIEMILAIQTEIMRLKDQLKAATKDNALKIQKVLDGLAEDLNELRKDTVYVSYASTFDNVHALGLEPLKIFKRTLTDFMFRISVANEEIKKIEGSFYAALDDEIHGRSKTNYDYYDTLPLADQMEDKRDCRWDGLLIPHLPLAIACDYNNAINSVVTGQKQGNKIGFMSSKFTLNPEMIDACITKWCDYYQHHPCKDVTYYYDSTAEQTSFRSNVTASDDWRSGLEDRGWNVTMVDVGHPPDHEEKHLLWVKICRGLDERLPYFFFDKDNCESWKTSCDLAGAKATEKGFKKDKSSEKKSDVPPQEATHISDAGDILLHGFIMDHLFDSSVYYEIVSK